MEEQNNKSVVKVERKHQNNGTKQMFERIFIK